MRTQKLVTQSQFLLGIGEANEFADAFEECRLPQERAKVALQLKHLVTPAGMGESFHVLVASKGVEPKGWQGWRGWVLDAASSAKEPRFVAVPHRWDPSTAWLLRFANQPLRSG